MSESIVLLNAAYVASCW